MELHKPAWTPTRDFEVAQHAAGRSGLRHDNLVVVRLAPRVSTEPQEVDGLYVLVDSSASRALGYAAQVTFLEKLLAGLRDELAGLDPEIADLAEKGSAKATEREVLRVLLLYMRALDDAMAGLLLIFENLEEDESGYRDTGTDGRSGFTRDKLAYDHTLSELERLGTRLNRLFANY